MLTKSLPLPPEQVTVNTQFLSDYWGVSERTVIRYCRFHAIPEIRFVPGGRILYSRTAIEELEATFFNQN